MEITLILGNGFDKNLGLETSYKEFYEKYKKKDTNIEIVKKMKNSIGRFLDGVKKGEDIINWGDAELAFGQFSKQCQSYEEYRDCYIDLQDSFAEYLAEEEKRFDINKIDERLILNCINDIVKYINKSNNGTILNIITLNYTSTIYEIFFKVKDKMKDMNYNINLKDYLFLHGSLKDQLTFGVGNIEQIKNENIRKSFPPAFESQIIKDRHDALTARNYYARLMAILNSSHVAYCYGWSFGDTDLALINRLAKRAAAGMKLYVYKHGFELKSNIRKSFEEKLFNDKNRDDIRNKLLAYGGLNNSEYAVAAANVVSICINHFEKIKNIVI